MPKIDPKLSVIENFPNPLTDGEERVLNYFVENLSEDWEVYVQPRINRNIGDC